MGVVSVYVIALPSIYGRKYVCGHAWGNVCVGVVYVYVISLPHVCMCVCMCGICICEHVCWCTCLWRNLWRPKVNFISFSISIHFSILETESLTRTRAGCWTRLAVQDPSVSTILGTGVIHLRHHT